jgi:hypothetical protein
MEGLGRRNLLFGDTEAKKPFDQEGIEVAIHAIRTYCRLRHLTHLLDRFARPFDHLGWESNSMNSHYSPVWKVPRPRQLAPIDMDPLR